MFFKNNYISSYLQIEVKRKLNGPKQGSKKKSFLIKKNGSNQSSVQNKTHAHNDVPPFQIELFVIIIAMLNSKPIHDLLRSAM